MNALARVQQRFWTHVERTDTCWQWHAATERGGYGVSHNAKQRGLATTTMAHRLAYEWEVGPIPEGLELDHLCRNRACVNPDHLEPVTHAENQRRRRMAATHCPQGHDLNADNNRYVRSTGYYNCRACNREAARLRQGYYERRVSA